ncbi:MAG: methyl-accepting chemotaxis protein [Treponema sp.]|nr:methyl-accepting chemotaxis protein [Treponema sp.]
MKSSKIFRFCLGSGILVCALAALSLGVQTFLAGGAADKGVKAVRVVVLAGGIINILLFVPGFLGLFFCVRQLLRKQESLDPLLRLLKAGNYRELLSFSKTENTGDAALKESFRSFGNLFESIESIVARSLKLRDETRGNFSEQGLILDRLGETSEKIIGQFSEIESSSGQAAESISSIEGYINSLQDLLKNYSSAEGETEKRLSRVSEMAEDVAERIRASAGKAGELRGVISTGGEQAEEVNTLVKNIFRQVEGISEMTAIINKISEQTNILSMNAAIESAHAGEAGKGFAVVADEIRKLAESTGENAGKINEEIKAIIQYTQSALRASETSVETFNTVTGEIEVLAKDLEEASSAAGETSSVNGEAGRAIEEGAALSRRVMEGSAGVMLNHQSFKDTLEMICTLSGAAKIEVREVHSGTKEVLDSIRGARERFDKSLEQIGELGNFFPAGDTGLSPEAAAVPAAAIQSQPDVSIGAGAAPALPREDEGYSDSRKVAVKKPPRIIL